MNDFVTHVPYYFKNQCIFISNKGMSIPLHILVWLRQRVLSRYFGKLPINIVAKKLTLHTVLIVISHIAGINWYPFLIFICKTLKEDISLIIRLPKNYCIV